MSHLVPAFDAWWPNIFAYLVQTPVVGTVVWLVHRFATSKAVIVFRELHTLHVKELREVHQAHADQVQAMLDDHRRTLGLPDTRNATTGQNAPTLPA